MIANFLSLGILAQQVPQQVYGHVYVREIGCPPVAYHGFDHPRLTSGLKENTSEIYRQYKNVTLNQSQLLQNEKQTGINASQTVDGFKPPIFSSLISQFLNPGCRILVLTCEDNQPL